MPVTLKNKRSRPDDAMRARRVAEILATPDSRTDKTYRLLGYFLAILEDCGYAKTVAAYDAWIAAEAEKAI